MGGCLNSPLYKFQNFVTIKKRKPKPKKGLNISKFQFQIHPFSTSYIHERIDNTYNEDLIAQQSFIITEENGMKLFEKQKQLITKRDKISECLKTAILGKICGQSVINQKNCIIFVEPQGRQQYKEIIFNIVLETLIDIDLTCFHTGRGAFGVYFDWPTFVQQQKGRTLLSLIQDVHKKNTLMDSTVKTIKTTENFL